MKSEQISLTIDGTKMEVPQGTTIMEGADQVAAKLKDELGIAFGETSSDGMFSLEGTCGLAPVLMVDDDIHPQVTPDQIPAILEKYLRTAREEKA